MSNMSLSKEPRLDPTERLRHRLYEPLYLKWILKASTKPTELKKRWRKVLDALAWFGDFGHGGRTVVAVALEDNPENLVLWVCGPDKKSANHIAQVAQKMLDTQNSNDVETSLANARLVISSSIHLSTDKIKTYKKSLEVFLNKILDTCSRVDRDSEPNVDGRELFERLEEIRNHLTASTSNYDLCEFAATFTGLSYITDCIRGSGEDYAALSRVRHYITRLGAWHRNANILLDFARSKCFPPELKSEYLPLPGTTHLPQVDSKTNLRSVAGRMFPSHQQDRAEEFHDQLSSLRLFDINDSFVQHYADESVSLAVHAEVYLLEHFYFQDLTYFAMDKYIGCSKASCYCCHLYQRFHPSHPALRPCHENTYPKWCPPLMADGSVLDASKGKHNLDIMNAMIAYIRGDVIADVDRRMPCKAKVPDSSTAFSNK
ncbi:Hypothetical protein R9X50_00602800 [Acrodontium crateriforme]|uniref:Uncharacterized protein n=1 Tax=Acrodontium crateriforme TaxID=150365 RepID=A0AAQ3MD07_9PEZI|nr:Hypothetical protein R9X50_00602800 [Acrodontium crateriforme]